MSVLPVCNEFVSKSLNSIASYFSKKNNINNPFNMPVLSIWDFFYLGQAGQLQTWMTLRKCLFWWYLLDWGNLSVLKITRNFPTKPPLRCLLLITKMICWRSTDIKLNYSGSAECVPNCCVEWLGQIFPRLEYNQQRKTGRQEALGLAMPPSLLLQVIIMFSRWSTPTPTHCTALLSSWFSSDSKTTVIVKLWPVQL